MLVATLLALIVRDNFEISPDRLAALLPYLTATAAVTLPVFALAGLNRAIWRFSALPDYVRILWAVSVVTVGAMAITFAVNRLDGVPRALPLLQAVFAIGILIGARVLLRQRHAARVRRVPAAVQLRMFETSKATTILIVGLSRLTEAYLQAIDDIAANRIEIAGLVGLSDRHVGRLVATHPVLGKPEEIEPILNKLEVHGVLIDRIVVTADFESLSPEAQESLLHVEREREIPVQFLISDLGLSQLAGGRNTAEGSSSELSFEIDASDLEAMSRRPYWVIKRAIDMSAAFALLALLSPVLLIVAVLAATSIGFPVTFWQQRPGLGGTPFRLYKFRTMSAAHTSSGRKLRDDERVSRIGNLLRRTRLDELPQLFHILRGDMSFVGPRPLLPTDQADAHRARLLVRPGLTGWAQVIGGREISAEDKAALDVWYVRNASLLLDIEIALRTVPMVLRGERMSHDLIEKAWNDLYAAGVIKGDETLGLHPRIRVARAAVQGA
jgi:lipopolysaccharide/colanic/teichoic acid biosynthesis glycosyltransferase